MNDMILTKTPKNKSQLLRRKSIALYDIFYKGVYIEFFIDIGQSNERRHQSFLPSVVNEDSPVMADFLASFIR